VLASQAPGSWPPGDGPEVAHPNVAPPVSLQRQSEHGVWADVNVVVHIAGQMHTEEAVARIRDRVEHASDEAAVGSNLATPTSVSETFALIPIRQGRAE
jgi:hypothetical protein